MIYNQDSCIFGNCAKCKKIKCDCIDKMNEYKIGDKVELLSMNDPYTTLKTGDRGIIINISYHNEFDQIWVSWYNGSQLALLSNIDKFKVISL